MEPEQSVKHPGRVLLEDVMEPLGVSRAQLARDIDVSTTRINALLAGKRSMTPDLALRLAAHFGTSAELWLKLQADYDLMVLRAGPWRAIEPRIRAFAGKLPGARSTVSEPESAVEPAPALPADPAPYEPESAALSTFTQDLGPDAAPLSESPITADAPVADEIDPDSVTALRPSEVEGDEPLELTELVDADELAVLELTECVPASESPAAEHKNNDLDIPDADTQGPRLRVVS